MVRNQLKAALRRDMLKKLEEIDTNTFEKKNKIIRRRLVNHPFWNNANLISVTLSQGREIETDELIRMAWSAGKRVAVPRCLPETRQLIFHALTSFDQLRKGTLGIREPIADPATVIESALFDLILVPGVLFDRKGYRIGYGAGYYDRLLSHPHGSTIALLTDEQLVDVLPVETHDQRIDVLITDREMIETALNRNGE